MTQVELDGGYAQVVWPEDEKEWSNEYAVGVREDGTLYLIGWPGDPARGSS